MQFIKGIFMTTSLNPQQMSPLTRGLFDRQQRFQKEAGNDSSLVGIVKVNLVGRVIRLGMALVLHAEAVSRAVYICFLSMQYCFNKSNKSLIEKQKVEGSTAMTVSLRAFFSIFYRKLLDGITIASPPAPQPLAASAPISTAPVVSVPEQPSQPPVISVVQVQPEQNGSQAPQPEPSQQPIVVQAPQSEAVPPVVAPISNPQPIQHIQAPVINPAHFGAHLPSQDSPPRQVSENINHIDENDQFEQEIGEEIGSLDSYSHIESDFSYSQLGISGSVSQPQTPGRNRLPRPTQEQKTGLTADEQARLDEAWKLKENQLNAFREENKLLNISEVELHLVNEMMFAGRNVHRPYTQLKLETGPDHHSQNQDPKWKISHSNTSGMGVGICQYAENPRELKAQYLITNFNLNIADTTYPVRLLGLFDPLIGSRASDYLSQNLTTALTQKLTAFNTSKLSDDGIYNAIKTTFLELNREFIETNKDKRADETFRDFIADQGSSATVVMIIDNKLWTAQLGNTRGAFNKGDDAVQLNVDQIPQFYQDKIKKLGGTVINGKVNDKLEMATVFGRNDLHGAASSSPGILRVGLDQFQENSLLILGTNGIFEIVSTELVVNWVSKSKETLDHIAHDIVYTIFSERQRQLKNNSLTCLIARINATTPQNELENKSNVNDHSDNTSFVNIDSKEPSDVSFVKPNRREFNLSDRRYCQSVQCK